MKNPSRSPDYTIQIGNFLFKNHLYLLLLNSINDTTHCPLHMYRHSSAIKKKNLPKKECDTATQRKSITCYFINVFLLFSCFFFYRKNSRKMNHKLVNSWVLLSLLMSTLVYSYPQPQAQSSHIAAQYLPKTVQPQAEQQQQQQQYQYLRFQQPQPRIQHYQVHSAPQYQQQPQQQNQQPAEIREAQPRKFAQKANAVKKVDLTDVENDIETNQIENTGPFSWTNMLGTFMQMVVQNSPANLPTKSEDTDSVAVGQTSPWANIISIGMYSIIIIFFIFF